jgi:L-ascorbate metabolism protein UlaG (beta-lactamase superfamily)
LTYHGHACFAIEGAGKTIWLDLFFTDNPLADVCLDDIEEADYILVSHGHGDHLGDAIAIAERVGAMIVSNHEIAVYCQERDVEADGLHIGGGYQFLVDVGGKRIYFAADTALFYDM